MPSPFYPPRARWYSPMLCLGHTLRRRCHLDDLNGVLGCSVSRLVAVVVLPAYGFYAAGQRSVGHVALAAYGVLTLMFLDRLGHPVATVAFGLMISLHATGTVQHLAGLHRLEMGQRMGLLLATLLLLAILVYRPVRDSVLARWVIPLRVRDRIVLVRRSTDPRTVKRGDWIACWTKRRWVGPERYLPAGYGLERVLALPGDHVRFAPGGYFVNGQAHPALAGMPTAGERVVPEKDWFVWPSELINRAGLSPGDLVGAGDHLTLVDQAGFLGEPFGRWFGRQQAMP